MEQINFSNDLYSAKILRLVTFNLEEEYLKNDKLILQRDTLEYEFSNSVRSRVFTDCSCFCDCWHNTTSFLRL